VGALLEIYNNHMVINDPLQLVIVRDMWLTRLDAPNCHTMYIDKPMKGHNLRVNRVFKDKPDGLVVDYIGIANELKHALKTYIKRVQKCTFFCASVMRFGLETNHLSAERLWI